MEYFSGEHILESLCSANYNQPFGYSPVFDILSISKVYDATVHVGNTDASAGPPREGRLFSFDYLHYFGVLAFLRVASPLSLP